MPASSIEAAEEAKEGDELAIIARDYTWMTKDGKEDGKARHVVDLQPFVDAKGPTLYAVKFMMSESRIGRGQESLGLPLHLSSNPEAGSRGHRRGVERGDRTGCRSRSEQARPLGASRLSLDHDGETG